MDMSDYFVVVCNDGARDLGRAAGADGLGVNGLTALVAEAMAAGVVVDEYKGAAGLALDVECVIGGRRVRVGCVLGKSAGKWDRSRDGRRVLYVRRVTDLGPVLDVPGVEVFVKRRGRPKGYGRSKREPRDRGRA